MIDREKVVMALTLCANGEPCMGEKYRTCPYSPIGKPEYYNCGAGMAADALALLKEQESVKPIDETCWDYTYGRCGHCKAPLPVLEGLKSKFCWMCGRAVRWA